MSLQLDLRRYRQRQSAPVTRLAEQLPSGTANWPTVSIVMLLCIGAILPPIVLTVMNAALVLLALVLAIITNQAIDRRLLHIVLPFTGIAFLGLATGVNENRYDYFKDAWYVANPVLVLLTGYVLYRGKPDLSRGLRAFVIGGTIVALWQVRGYVFNPDIILLPAGVIRRYIGTGLYAPVLAVMVLTVFVGRWKNSLRLPTAVGSTLLVITVLSVAGVFSRTALLVELIGLAALAGCFAKREWLRLVFPLAIALGLSFVLQLLVDTESDRALQTFTGKLIRSAKELTVSEYADTRNVNLNFRGHETRQAINQFEAGSVPQMLFGQGFGSKIDLGFALPLQGDETGSTYVRYITYLHNGYMFLLTKVGLIGLILYVYVLAYLYLVARPAAALPLRQQSSRIGRLLQGCVITLAATTYIVGGVFNKLDMFPFMLLTGFLLAHLNRPAEPATPASPTPARIRPL